MSRQIRQMTLIGCFLSLFIVTGCGKSVITTLPPLHPPTCTPDPQQVFTGSYVTTLQGINLPAPTLTKQGNYAGFSTGNGIEHGSSSMCSGQTAASLDAFYTTTLSTHGWNHSVIPGTLAGCSADVAPGAFSGVQWWTSGGIFKWAAGGSAGASGIFWSYSFCLAPIDTQPTVTPVPQSTPVPASTPTPLPQAITCPVSPIYSGPDLTTLAPVNLPAPPHTRGGTVAGFTQSGADIVNSSDMCSGITAADLDAFYTTTLTNLGWSHSTPPTELVRLCIAAGSPHWTGTQWWSSNAMFQWSFGSNSGANAIFWGFSYCAKQ